MRYYKQFKEYRFYWFAAAVALIKLCLMALFSSDYQDLMFRPFVETFLQNIGSGNWNIYDYYYEHHLLSSFPYPPFMLIIESVGGMLIHIFRPASVYVINFLFKLPLLGFDCLGLWVLLKMFPRHKRYIGAMYWMSPIVLYAVYMHGQLDIIPTALLMLSLYSLTKRDYSYRNSAMVLGLALLTKMHILAVVPIILMYIYRRSGIRKAVCYLLQCSALFAVGIFFFRGNGLLNTVFLNSEQGVITKVYFSLPGDIRIYIPLIAVLFIYLLAYGTIRFNRDLLLAFCGVTFSVFLALCPPMPGWYVWIVPFIMTFFIGSKENKYHDLVVYLLLNCLYLLYFFFFHKTAYTDLYVGTISLDPCKISQALLRNITFTLLSGTLIFIIISMYRQGVSSNYLYKRKQQPFAIGITGDSSSGKSTLVELLSECLGKSNVLLVEGDGDHRWERGASKWKKYTHLNPQANYLYRQALNIQQLKKGNSVNRVDYDHATGKFTESHRINPRRYILFNGLHSLYLPQMRQAFDLKIYMDADEELRRYWKIHRDISERGYTEESILQQIDSRVEDSEAYIVPQRKYADLVISYFSPDLEKEREGKQYTDLQNIEIDLRVSFNAAINMEPFVAALRQYGITIAYSFEDNLDKQHLLFDNLGKVSSLLPFDEIAEKVIPDIGDLTGERILADSNLDGIVMLVVLKMIDSYMTNNM